MDIFKSAILYVSFKGEIFMGDFGSDECSKEQKKFLRENWQMALLIFIAGVIAVAGAILVFLNTVENMQATGAVPMMIGEWTVGFCITFFLNLLLWELIIVGIPVAVAGFAIYMLWWRKLPKDKWPRRDEKKSSDEGAFSFIVTIAWLIIVWIEGKWDLAFQSWTLNEWVYTWLSAFLWVVFIGAIIGAIVFVVWLTKDQIEKL